MIPVTIVHTFMEVILLKKLFKSTTSRVPPTKTQDTETKKHNKQYTQYKTFVIPKLTQKLIQYISKGG